MNFLFSKLRLNNTLQKYLQSQLEMSQIQWTASCAF